MMFIVQWLNVGEVPLCDKLCQLTMSSAKA